MTMKLARAAAWTWLRDAGLLDGAGGYLADDELVGGNVPSKRQYRRDTPPAARRVWDATKPLAGTPAETYLHARGVGHVAVAPALPGVGGQRPPPRRCAMPSVEWKNSLVAVLASSISTACSHGPFDSPSAWRRLYGDAECAEGAAVVHEALLAERGIARPEAMGLVGDAGDERHAVTGARALGDAEDGLEVRGLQRPRCRGVVRPGQTRLVECTVWPSGASTLVLPN